MPVPKPRRTLHAQMLYTRALLRRFRGTFAMLVILVFGGGALIWLLNRQGHTPITLGRGFVTAYFLLFAQTVGEVPEQGLLEVVY
ncbi:MAG: hypothetical protein JST92_01380, partial [Deltaproteobacteria bacterium]|nr:hypothetical protein [Deltaproteobacteria bacterium]